MVSLGKSRLPGGVGTYTTELLKSGESIQGEILVSSGQGLVFTDTRALLVSSLVFGVRSYKEIPLDDIASVKVWKQQGVLGSLYFELASKTSHENYIKTSVVNVEPRDLKRFFESTITKLPVALSLEFDGNVAASAASATENPATVSARSLLQAGIEPKARFEHVMLEIHIASLSVRMRNRTESGDSKTIYAIAMKDYYPEIQELEEAGFEMVAAQSSGAGMAALFFKREVQVPRG